MRLRKRYKMGKALLIALTPVIIFLVALTVAELVGNETVAVIIAVGALAAVALFYPFARYLLDDSKKAVGQASRPERHADHRAVSPVQPRSDHDKRK